jgi:hypothetical protein
MKFMFVGPLDSSYVFLKFMSAFYPYLCKPKLLVCLVMITYELAFGTNNKVVDNFLSFLESLGSPLFDVYNFSYDWNTCLLRCCPGSMLMLRWLLYLDFILAKLVVNSCLVNASYLYVRDDMNSFLFECSYPCAFWSSHDQNPFWTPCSLPILIKSSCPWRLDHIHLLSSIFRIMFHVLGINVLCCCR